MIRKPKIRRWLSMLLLCAMLATDVCSPILQAYAVLAEEPPAVAVTDAEQTEQGESAEIPEAVATETGDEEETSEPAAPAEEPESVEPAAPAEEPEPAEPAAPMEEPDPAQEETAEEPDSTQEETAEEPAESENVLEGKRNAPVLRVAAAPGSLQELINLIEDGESGTITLTRDYTENIVIPDGKTVTIDLNGYTITGKREGNGSVNAVTVYGDFTLTGDGTITSGGVSNIRGVTIASGATFHMEGGTITGFDVTGNGGGVRVENRGKLVMTGGEITGNSASDYGGGVFAYNGNTGLDLTGGTISDNTAPSGGGLAIYETGGVTTVGGVTIKNNTADTYGGGVYLAKQGTLNLKANIKGNSAPRGGGVYLYTGSTTTITGGEISGNQASVYGGGIFTGVSTTLTVTDGLISENIAGEMGGGIYILSDNSNRSTFRMEGGTIDGNKLSEDGSERYGAGVCVGDYCTVNLSDGTISNNKGAASGGGLKTGAACAVTISGGEITGNSAVNGGGMFLSGNSSTATVTGGTFTENDAGSSGGFAYISQNCTITVKGGTYADNRTDGDGGAIRLAGAYSRLIAEAGTFSNNYAKGGGGAVSKETTTGGITISGGSYTGNEAGGSGGAISSAINITVQGTTVISENTAGSSGGGIQTSFGMTVSGDVQILNNKATTGNGGGLSTGQTITINGATVRGNSAGGNGGGMYAGIINATDVTLDSNTATGSGGGFYLPSHTCSATIKNCTFTGNRAANGGGFGSESGNLTVDNCTLTGNTATASGGGIYITGWGAMNLSNSVVTGNSANYGGGITASGNGSMSGATETMSDTVITGNNATVDGGGIYQTCGTIKVVGGKIDDNKAVRYGNDVGIYSANDRVRPNYQLPAAADMEHVGASPVWYDEMKAVNLTDAVSVTTANLGLGTSAAYFGYTYTDEIPDAVARIGTTDYPTLQEAFNAIESDAALGTEILLLKDTKETVTVAENVTATLDLDGHTVKGNGASVFTVKKGADLTIDDTSDSGNGRITGGKGNPVKIGTTDATAGGGIYTEGKVTLKNGSIYNNSATYGAGVYVGPFGNFTMDGGKVRLNRNGRGVSMWYKDQDTVLNTTDATATFTMNSGEISGNVGGVYADNANDSVNMNGGTISGNSGSVSGAGIYVNNGAVLTMKGGTISGNTTTGTNRGGGIYVGTNSKAYIYDGEITGNTSGSNGGGGIAVCGANAELYVYGGKITNNNGGALGGGISSDNAKLVQIEGGEISGNTATYGGGVCGVTTTVNLKDAKITGNTANSGGGGIFMNSGATLNMEGGEVTDNTATNNGGGIYGGVGNGTSRVNITGGLVTDNQAGTNGGGVVIASHGSITGGRIYGNTAKGALRGNDVVLREIRKENTPLIPAGNMNVDGVTCWLNDNTNEEYYETDQLASDCTTAYYLTATNGHRDHVARIGDVPYLTLQAAIDAAEAGDEIFLLKDIEEFMTVSADQDVIVNFNGYTISTTATNGFTVDSGKLTLRDEPAEDGKEGGTGTLKPAEGLTNGRGILARDSATITLESGTISGYTLTTAYTSGAGIRALCSTVNIRGGVIENCSATAYGAVAIDNATYNKPFHFNMSGGEIRNNTAINGGAIGINSGDNFENTTAITGGTISGNTANAGGGIYITGTAATNKNVVDIFGVTVEDNTAKLGSGGGIYINQTPQVTLGSPNEGTIIQRNTCTGNGNAGGGVMLSGAFDNPSIRVENVTITENSSVSGGARAGGMYVSGSADIVDCKITDNTASGQGGGLEVGRSAYTRWVNITDTEISGNTATNKGGGLYVAAESGDSTAVITLSGVTVENNTANTAWGDNGGGVYIEDGTNSAHVTLKNGTKVTGNTLNGGNWDSGGGGIAVTGSKTTLELFNAEVTDNNNRNGSAGGIYVKSGAKLVLNAGAKVAGNSTAGAGGGICTYGTNSTVTLYEGAEVSGNTARTSSGGGILVRTGGKLNMEDGAKISGNTAATSGGGVCVDSDAVMIMTGGEITGNETTGTAANWDAKYGGGGIYFGATNAAGSITGGTISGNKSAQDGGGILVAGDNNGNGVQNVIVDGATVTGNTAARYGGGVWAWHGTKFQLKSGGIYDNSAKLGQDVYAYYRSGYRSEVELIAASKMDFDGGKEGLGWLDEDNGNVIETDIQGKMVRRYALTLDYVNKDDVVAVIGDEEFATVQDAIAYIMEKDLSDAEIRIVKDVHENVNVPSGVKAKLNLNGYTLLGLPAAITCYGDLTIVDEPEDVTANGTDYPAGEGTGTITGHAADEGGGIQVKPGGTVTLESGQIANCTAVNNGAAVLVENGTFVMNGGTIKDNDAVSGAAVYVKSGSSTFTMNGGEITENTGRTGIVYNNGGTASIYGGKLTGNKVNNVGGAISQASGTTSIAGSPDAPVEIADNTATQQGGGIYVGGGTVRITNATISGNKTTAARTGTVTQSAGGGIFVDGGILSIGTGANITGNTAVRGGGVYANGGTVKMMGGLITGNSASYAGGGVAQNPGNRSDFILMQGGVYNNRSILSDAGNDFYSKYEGTDDYSKTAASKKPRLSLIAASSMGNENYNVWKDDDYSGTTRTAAYILEGQYITEPLNECNNVELTADYYADAQPMDLVSSDFVVETLFILDPDGNPDMKDGTSGFDTGAAEVFARDLLASGRASESGETYVYNGKNFRYIDVGGTLYEQDQAVEWVAGDDRRADNTIVRTFDDVQYTLTSTVRMTSVPAPETGNGAEEDEKKTIHVFTEVVLPCSYEEATFKTDSSSLDMKGYTIFEEMRDGQTVQVLRGYWEITDVGQAVTLSKNIFIRIKAMKNGDLLKPTFRQWIEGNEENEENSPTAESKMLTISAAGKYNVTLEANSDLAYTGYFDLTTGSEASEEDALARPGEVIYGTMLGYGLTVELYNTSQEKQLKGIELPDRTLGFDLRLKGDLFLNGEPLLNADGEQIRNAPYIWAYKENNSSSYGMPLGGTSYRMNMNWNDEDDLAITTRYSYDSAPYNSGGGSNGCYSGGGWSMTGSQPGPDDEETLVHFTVSDYAFDDSLNPTQNANGSSSGIFGAKNVKAFTAGYLQVIFPFEPEEVVGDGTGYVAINMQGAVSDLDIKTASGLDPATTDNGLDTLNTYFDDEDETAAHATGEMHYGDNYLNYQTGLYVFKGGGPGDLITKTNFFSGQNGNGIGTRLPGGNGSEGNSSTPLGTAVYVGADLIYNSETYRTDDPEQYPDKFIPDEEFNPQTDNKVEYNYMTALNLLQKFDGEVLVPVGTGAVVDRRFNNTGSSNSIGGGAFVVTTTETKPSWDNVNAPATWGYDLTILYAAKPDGTNWIKKEIGDGLNDGGVADMDNYREEDLLYFTTLDELESYFAAQGKSGTCVAILYEFRNCCIRTGRKLVVNSRMQTPDDFSYTGFTYATTNDVRIWSTYRPDYKAARADGTLNQLLYQYTWEQDVPTGMTPGASGKQLEQTVTSKYFDGYKKTQYENGNMKAGSHSGWYSGNSILLYTLDSSISIRNTDIPRGSNAVQETYNVSKGERIANFRIDPSVTVSSATQNHKLVTNGTQSTAVTITLDLPKGLTYREGSVAFDYSADVGSNGKPSTEPRYNEGELDWDVEIQENADGTTRLVFKTYITDISKRLPDITYSAKIGDETDPDNDVGNGQSLKTNVSIRTEYEEHNQLAANTHSDSVTIKVKKDPVDGIFKNVREILREVGEEFVYELTYSNMTEYTYPISMVDVLPYNGDGRDTDFEGGYRVYQIVLSVNGTNAEQTFQAFVTDGGLYYLAGQAAPVANPDDANQMANQQRELFAKFESAQTAAIKLTGTADAANRTVTYTITGSQMQTLATDGSGIAVYAKFPNVYSKTAVHFDLYLTPVAPDKVIEDGNLKAALIEDESGKTQTGSNLYWNDFCYKSTSVPVTSGKVYVETVNRSITGYAWMDQDQDGKFTKASGDRLLKGINACLYEANEDGSLKMEGGQPVAAKDVLGNEMQPVETDINGQYLFENVGPGHFVVVFDDPNDSYSVVDNGKDTQKQPMDFSQLSVTLRDPDIQKLTDANRGIPVYTQEDSGNALAPLNNAILYRAVTMPAKGEIRTGHYISSGWNLGLYYVDAAIEKNWQNMVKRVPEGTKVTFPLTGMIDDLNVYNGTFVLTQGEDINNVTAQGPGGAGYTVSTPIFRINGDAPPTYIWKLEHILLQAEGSTGRVNYTFEEHATLNGAPLEGYDTELSTSVGEDGITVFQAENRQKVMDFGFTKVDSADMDTALKGAEFKLYSDENCEHAYLFVKSGEGEYHLVYDGITAASTTETLTVGSNSAAMGILSLTALPYGTYYLKETKAPEGYLVPEGSWKLVLSDAGIVITAPPTQLAFVTQESSVTVNGVQQTVTSYKLPNIKPMDVPFTGAYGVQTYLSLGFMMALGGTVMLLVYRRRKRMSQSDL